MQESKNQRVNFALQVDMLTGNSPLLLGLPSLKAMRAKIMCHEESIEICVAGKNRKIPLGSNGNHIFLPCLKFRRTSGAPSYASVASGNIYKIGNDPSPSSLQFVPKDSPGIYPRTLLTTSLSPVFDFANLRRIHINASHASLSDMVTGLKWAKVWKPEMYDCLVKLLENCSCFLSRDKKPHPIVSMEDTEDLKLQVIKMDFVYFNGIPFLHVMDKKLKWSEIGMLRDRPMKSMLSILKERLLYRYGTPAVI